MAQKFKLIGYDETLSYMHTKQLQKLLGSDFVEGHSNLVAIDCNNSTWPREWLILEPINTISQLQEQRSDLSAQISEMDYKWYEQLVIDDVMNLNDPKQFVMDLCEKLNIDLEIIDERNDEER